jgi:glycosyltransferase involved in cell wall biosynthesis
VYVIPLRLGGGTRLKVFEAMGMEKPIVSTSIGVEGLPVVDGTDVVIADEPQVFADAVLHLLRDRVFARRIGMAAAAKVRAQFGWKPVAESFLKACDLAIKNAGERCQQCELSTISTEPREQIDHQS